MGYSTIYGVCGVHVVCVSSVGVLRFVSVVVCCMRGVCDILLYICHHLQARGDHLRHQVATTQAFRGFKSLDRT